MEVLRMYHTLNLQAKTTGYSFYRSLEYLTDATGLHNTPVRLPVSSIIFHTANHYLQDLLDAFMLMAREWRHLKMLKRAGRAYDPSDDRVGNTPAGSLAIPCRACPQPGMNIPLDLDAVEPSKRCVPTFLIPLLL